MRTKVSDFRPSWSTCVECGHIVGRNMDCENCRRTERQQYCRKHRRYFTDSCATCLMEYRYARP